MGLDFDLDALEAELREGKAGKLGEIVGLALITRLRAAEARTAWNFDLDAAPMGDLVLGQPRDITRRPVFVQRVVRPSLAVCFVDDLCYAVDIIGWMPLPAPPASEVSRG